MIRTVQKTDMKHRLGKYKYIICIYTMVIGVWVGLKKYDSDKF